MALYLGVQGSKSLLLAPPSENAKPDQDTLTLRRNCSASHVLRILGVDALYNGYLPVRVIHRTSVQRITESGEIIIDDHQVSFHARDLPFAKKGGVMVVGADKQKLTLKSPMDRSKKGLQTWVAV